MKHFTQALLAWLLTSSVRAASQEPNKCLGDLHDASTKRISEVVVWVNENGDSISTETSYLPTATHVAKAPLEILSDSPSPSTPTSNAPSTLLKHAKPQAQDETVPTSDSTSSRVAKPPPHADPHPHPGPPPPHPPTNQHPDNHRQFGISYSPYAADRSCKSQDQINKDLDALSSYSFIRIYGTDCDQTKLVANAARTHNMKVFAGIYDLTGFPQSLDAFKEAVTDASGTPDWSIYHTIAVGNELVNGGHNSPAQVTGAVTQARTYLAAQGYHGPVVTVDTFSVLLKHPELCHVSDYCAANCHAFFDANQQPHNAGPYALEQMHSVSAAAGGKHTLITESGWPHAGQANGAAVPSQENQRIAVESLRRSFAHEDLVLFTAFDDLWKDDNRYTFNAERFWGIHDR